MKRRLFSLLLAVCMLLMILPATSLAEEIPSAPAEAGAATPVQDGDATPSASPAQSPAAEEGQKPQEGVRIEPVQPDDAYLTVVFQDKDGGEIATVVAKNGESVSAPAAPEVDGMTFIGWYSGDDKVKFPLEVNVSADVTLSVQARYEGALYVFFHNTEGTVIATRSGKPGDTVSVSGVSFPLTENQSITGWYTETACINRVDSVELKDSNIDLYPKVEEGYWLTFETNGGSYIEPMFFPSGAKAQMPATPIKPGHTFGYWYTDAALTQRADFNTISSGMTLYAGWVERTDTKYAVHHMIENADNEEYSLLETETRQGETGTLTYAIAKKYNGFTAQPIEQKTIDGDGTTIVSVYYKRNVYTVQFYSNSYITGPFWNETYHPAVEYTALRITAKYGANISSKWPTYNGSNSWATSDNGDTYQSNIDKMPLGGAKFYGPKSGNGQETAYYYVEVLPGENGTVTKNGVKYKLDHSDTSPGRGYIVTDEDKYPITGFTYKEGTSNGANYDGAKFYYTRNSYTIFFINEGETEKTVSKKYQESISDQAGFVPTPPADKTDHTFNGWYVDKEGTVEFVFEGQNMPAHNITVYADWDEKTYTVTAHGKGDHAKIVEKGETVSPDLFASVIPDVGEGETFMGWTEQQGSTRLFNFATRITRDIHLYPVIMDGKTYTLTYDVNGGTGTVPTDTNKYAKGTYAQVVSGSGLTREGMIFLGWSTDKTAVSPAYYPGGSVKINDNTTLYAVWGTPTGKAAIIYHSNFGNDQTRKSEDKPINSLITVEGYGNLPSRTGYEFTGWNTASNGSGTAYAAGATARLTAGGNDLYAQWKAKTYDYTVEYYIDGEKDNSLTVTAQAEYDTVISTYPDKCPENYRLDRAEPLRLTIGVNENVIRVYYVKNVFTLTIHYLYADGSTAAADHVESLMQGTEYSVTSREIPGYTVNKETVSGKMPAKDVTETVIYTKRSDLSYTVNYYWNGTGTKVKESKKVDGKTFESSVTEAPETIEGYTPVSDASKTITIGVENNVIDFYYYKNVALTANSKTETFDNTEKSVSGFTGAPEDADFTAITVGAKGTSAGEYPAKFPKNTVGTVDATEKYFVAEANDGMLVITANADEVVVMIRGNSDTKVYDGTEYTVTDYVVESISNTLYTEKDFTFSGTAEAKRTRFGKSEMGLEPENFTNNNQNFTKVTFVVKDGYIDITKRPLKLVGETATKPYTGSSISLDQFTPENLADGDTVQSTSISYLAFGTMPNEYPGEFKGTPKIFNGNDDDVTDCYEVTRIPGKLTITKATETVVVRIVGNTKTVTYNGSEQSVEGFTTDVGNKPITVTLKEGRKAEAKGTLPNKYPMNLKAEDFDIKSDVYESFEVIVEDGWLQIEPTEAEVTVTITGNRRTVTYNGSEQSVEGFTTDVGDKPITVMLKDGGKAEAKGRYVGRYMMGLTEGDFKVDSTVYKNVKVIVIDGYLDIQSVYNPSVYPDYDPTPTPSPSYVPDPYRSPKTGDDSRIALWLTLMGLSAAAIAGVIVFDKKRRRS